MLYLEDYLEMIENLPMEMRDKFTEVREMDLQVANAMDSLDEKLKNFFKKCATTNLKAEWKDEQMAKIKQDYQKTLEDADEKVQLANQIYELVERHLRKLDQEVAKFKMELEADNAGITEILEKRASEAERPAVVNNHRPEKRKYSMLLNDVGSRHVGSDRLHLSSMPSDIHTREVVSRSVGHAATPSPVSSVFEAVQRPQAVVNYNFGQVGSGSNAAIAVAASRAIGATLEMQQGRRTASLKASYEAVSKSVELTKELALGREYGTVSSRSAQASSMSDNIPTTKTSSSRNKKSGSRASHQQHVVQMQPVTSVVEVAPAMEPLEIAGVDGMSATWQPDPNEPRYCLCNDVSYGDMVGCDNEDCPIEWFHYGCVGLTQAPRGKWYCPQCHAAMKRRGRK